MKRQQKYDSVNLGHALQDMMLKHMCLASHFFNKIALKLCKCVTPLTNTAWFYD